MELQILHGIQGLHNEFLNSVMIFFSTIGNGGMCWIVVSILLAVIPRTRKCGFTMMASMALTFLLGNVFLKNLIAGPRPFMMDNSVTLLIPEPSEYSFPSGHTANSFAAAVVICAYFRRAGIAALVMAATIAFSRMYLFVHYPTDILGGIALGTLDACIVMLCIYRWNRMRGANEAGKTV